MNSVKILQYCYHSNSWASCIEMFVTRNYDINRRLEIIENTVNIRLWAQCHNNTSKTAAAIPQQYVRQYYSIYCHSYCMTVTELYMSMHVLCFPVHPGQSLSSVENSIRPRVLKNHSRLLARAIIGGENVWGVWTRLPSVIYDNTGICPDLMSFFQRRGGSTCTACNSKWFSLTFLKTRWIFVSYIDESNTIQ